MKKTERTIFANFLFFLLLAFSSACSSFAHSLNSTKYSGENVYSEASCTSLLVQKIYTTDFTPGMMDLLAEEVELEEDDDFDRAIDRSSNQLAALAREALAEHRAGQTEARDPERL